MATPLPVKGKPAFLTNRDEFPDFHGSGSFGVRKIDRVDSMMAFQTGNPNTYFERSRAKPHLNASSISPERKAGLAAS